MRPRRKLDDSELDSGDDEERDDRLAADGYGDEDMEMEAHSANIMDIKLGRHTFPEPSDGEVCGQSSIIKLAHEMKIAEI